MEVKEEYIKKYWHEIVRDQITDELKEEGFQVFDNYSVDGFTADLYAEKGEDKRIIEIKIRLCQERILSNCTNLQQNIISNSNWLLLIFVLSSLLSI